MERQRYLTEFIARTLKKKMAFIGGPRQVGKTTLALGILGPSADEKHPAYLNLDHPLVPPSLKLGGLPPDEPFKLTVGVGAFL